MKQITDITELTSGVRIVEFCGDRTVFWEYLCQHPRNPEYVLLLESLSQLTIPSRRSTRSEKSGT